MKEFTKKCLKASLQYGHLPKYWNPKMAPYILEEKYGLHIFDLHKTSVLLKIAGAALQKKVEKGGKILFVGTNKLSSTIVMREAIRSNSFYVSHRWLGGMLTNWSTIQKRIKRLNILERQIQEEALFELPKKEVNAIRKETNKLSQLLAGVKNMQHLPSVVVFASQLQSSLAIEECSRLGIPTISIVDTNCDPSLVTYPIPANDDSIASINFILSYLASKILNAQKN